MNQWKVILEALRKHYAYEGDGSLADVQRFIKEADIGDMIRFAKEGETLESVHAKSKKKPILVLANGDEEEDEAQDDGDEDKPKVKTPQGPAAKRHRIADASLSGVTSKSFREIAERKRYDRLASKGMTRFDSADQCQAFGSWLKVTAVPKMATDEDREIVQKANVGTSLTGGGAFIPEEFATTLIDLKEKYGVARQVCGITPMLRDQLTVPKRTGGLTVYSPGEGGTITESNPTTTNVNLVSIGMKTLTDVSAELLNDSSLSFIDFVGGEIAQAFANKEDDCYFTGDGTAVDFNVAGFTTKMLALSATRANIAGLYVGSGNQASEFTLPDFEGVLGLAPSYVDNEPEACWVCHKRFFTSVMMRLELAAGGVTAMEIRNGVRVPMFLGYPVKCSQVMPRDTGSSTGYQDTVACLFGAFNLASKFGEVRGGMEIATSTDFHFNLDTVSIRGKQRVAINAHDVGNASGTESLRIPGPVVGLLGAAS